MYNRQINWVSWNNVYRVYMQVVHITDIRYTQLTLLVVFSVHFSRVFVVAVVFRCFSAWCRKCGKAVIKNENARQRRQKQQQQQQQEEGHKKAGRRTGWKEGSGRTVVGGGNATTTIRHKNCESVYKFNFPAREFHIIKFFKCKRFKATLEKRHEVGKRARSRGRGKRHWGLKYPKRMVSVCKGRERKKDRDRGERWWFVSCVDIWNINGSNAHHTKVKCMGVARAETAVSGGSGRGVEGQRGQGWGQQQRQRRVAQFAIKRKNKFTLTSATS